MLNNANKAGMKFESDTGKEVALACSERCCFSVHTYFGSHLNEHVPGSFGALSSVA